MNRFKLPGPFVAEWKPALGDATARAPGAPQLFLESREDLLVEIRDGSDPVAAHSWWSGLSAGGSEGSSPVAYLADPRPGDAAGLVRSVAGAGPFPRSARGTGIPYPETALSPVDASRWLEFLVDRVLRLRPGASVSARWVGFEQQVLFADAGAVCSDRRGGRRVRVEARLERGGKSSSSVAEAVLPERRPDAERAVIERLAESVAARVERGMHATPPPGGGHAVVFAPGVGGVLLHEVVGHALEADTVQRGASWLREPGMSAAADGVTVIDDPRRGRGAWRIDDEGMPSRAVPLLRAGRVVGRLHDRATSRLQGEGGTGHGRRSSYRERVQPRMGCTFAAPGALSAEDVVRDTSLGIYVGRMEAGSTDTATGRAVFRVVEADLIVSGRVDRPLTPHLLCVDGPRAMASMDRIADDLAFDTCIGSCHREGQPLVTSVGAPTFRIGVATVMS